MPIPLSQIVDVVTTVTAAGISAPTYNVGLIIGPTRILGPSGVPLTIATYPSTSAMLAAGYGANSPELLAAENYFAQSPAPATLYVGLQDATALGTVAVDLGGQNYVVGDTITVAQTGAQGGHLTVTTVGTGGAITGLTTSQTAVGTGYSVATALPVTGGSGTGAEINIVTVGQSALQAVETCRLASSGWYGVTVCGAAKADHLAIAAFVEGAAPDSFYFAATSDADSLAGASTSVLAQAQESAFKNSLLTYSTTQTGEYPANAYMGAAVMGEALGLFSGLPGSYYTIANKTLANVVTEPLNFTQFSTILNLNGNAYVSTGSNGTINVFKNGATPSGQWFDQTIFAKAFAADLQAAIFNVIVNNPAVGQDDSDQQQFLSAAAQVCQKYVSIGWIAPGTYNGTTVLNLTPGTALPKGYYVQSASYSTQTSAARNARQAMPVLVSVCLRGAVQSLTVGVTIQQ